MSWIFEALKGLFDATINVVIDMCIALFGKVERSTYNGPAFLGPVYINPIIVKDQETAVEMAKELQSATIVHETETPQPPEND